MRSEIGSEFWDIPVCSVRNCLFPDDTRWFLAGRTALQYIIQDSGIKSVSMPAWCCDSMVAPFLDSGVKVEFFFELTNCNTDALFLMDYFGYSSGKTYTKPEKYKGVVIRDLTHSIFSKKYDDANYYFGSLRKWAGFYTGGFAWGEWKQHYQIAPCDEDYVQIRRQAMAEKKRYIFEEIESKDYLRLFEQASQYLKQTGICGATEEDIVAAQYFDVEAVVTKRRRNARILLNEVQGMFRLGDGDCPLFVPIETSQRNQLRSYLIKNEIYCPVHWPRYDCRESELSLICDQRYEEEDMNRVCKAIHRFYAMKEVNEKEM